jgi:hypothetical protein
VARPLRPVVWGLAVVWLALQKTGDGLLRCSTATTAPRTPPAARRPALGRALLRVLGPLGRALRRLALPVLRLLRRVWDVLGVRLLLRMFRRSGAGPARPGTACTPLAERLQRAVQRLAARLEPVLRGSPPDCRRRGGSGPGRRQVAPRPGARCARACCPAAAART